MKRLFLVAILFLCVSMSSLALKSSAYAATDPPTPVDPLGSVCDNADPSNLPSVCKENLANSTKSAADLNPISGNGSILMRVFKLLTFITGVASIIIIIVSGLKYVTADGDSNSINSAKQTLLYALIGVAVSLIAQGIIIFVVKAVK